MKNKNKKRTSRVGLRYKGRKVFVNAEKINGLRKGIGLMFARRDSAKALLFDFHGKTKLLLHSFFVFFPFLAIWLDDKNKILEIKTVRPFSLNILSEKTFSKVVEIPLNQKYKKITEKLVGKERFK